MELLTLLKFSTWRLHDLENPPVWRVLDATLDTQRMTCAAVVVNDEFTLLVAVLLFFLRHPASVQVLDGNTENLSQGP